MPPKFGLGLQIDVAPEPAPEMVGPSALHSRSPIAKSVYGWACCPPVVAGG